MKRYLLPMVFALALVGCDQAPKIDGSSEEALRYSGDKVMDSLSSEKQKELEAAMIAIERYSSAELSTIDKLADNEAVNRMSLAIYNNKTADEIIAEAEKLKPKTEARKKKLEDEAKAMSAEK
ncbi:TPA: DUF6694 family lipoprotein [Serratia odorifera]